MTPAGLSAFKASRLSFLRLVVRRMVRERWRIEPHRFELDDRGRGTVIYRLLNPGPTLYFVVYSDDLPESKRTDRIIENHYDGEALLCLDEPDQARIDYQRGQVRDFLLGRADVRTLGWTRVNRSGRVFEAVVEALTVGRQPSSDLIASAGYLVRNNGFWGNGRHGTAIFPSFAPGSFLGQPYHIDLLTLYLWRHFSFDLVDHIARARVPGAAQLAPATKRALGMGNASGLGLVPFVVRHPLRVHRWVETREMAITLAKAGPATPDGPEAQHLLELIDRAIAYYAGGLQVRPGIFQGSAGQVADLTRLQRVVQDFVTDGRINGARPDLPWVTLCDWAEQELDREGLELLHSLLIEIRPEIADALEDRLLSAIDDRTDVRPEQRTGDLHTLVRENYGWALELDLNAADARRHFWYLSTDNLEPRHGLRGVDPGEEFETFVDLAGALQDLDRDLASADPERPVAAFLLAHPEHRFVIERVQSVAPYRYGEVRANLLGDDFEPCHLIRFLLTQYGMEKLDPQSRLWVRGTFLQGAPLAEEIAEGHEGDWIFPIATPST